MSLVEDRFQAVDFSVPYFLDSDSFVIKNPLPPPRWSSIIFPFSWVTWIALCMVLLWLPVILIFLNKLEGVGQRDRTSMFMDVTKALLRQDSPPITSHLSIRVFIGNWWLMAMILSISYTGNLIAFITIPAKAQKMRTLQEVAESDLTPVMIDYGNFMHSVMQKSGDKTLMILGEKLQFLPNDDYQAGFDMVDEGKAAFLEGTEYFRYMVILFKAWNTYFLEEVFFPSYVGWIYPKKTAWKHKFDKYLQRFVEAGLPTYWRNKLADDFRREMNLTRLSSKTSSRPLNLVDLQNSNEMPHKVKKKNYRCSGSPMSTLNIQITAVVAGGEHMFHTTVVKILSNAKYYYFDHMNTNMA
ncbi:ionotropic receptor 21a-like [Palaemon carinicauda]|uniref:ionotropic receptor 21a-like n=1 Tax=Palaemon carinicauda TaxID=392227 RepID=UPI0035B6446C